MRRRRTTSASSIAARRYGRGRNDGQISGPPTRDRAARVHGWDAGRAPGALLALALVGGAVNAPFRSASGAAVPNLVAAEDLTWANGLLGSAMNAALVTGPLVGGALVAAAGPRCVFAVNAVSFVVSA